MDQKTYDKGLEIRKAVLGEAHVNNTLKSADSFNKPFQDLLNEYCWGAVWGREELPRKTRSMLNIAMISILNRPHELRAHLKGALTNGVTREEIREILMQVAIYGGMPAAVDSFRVARESLHRDRQRLKATESLNHPPPLQAKRSNPEMSPQR
jgi:4-carboxymuconolactone decarboxylase